MTTNKNKFTCWLPRFRSGLEKSLHCFSPHFRIFSRSKHSKILLWKKLREWVKAVNVAHKIFGFWRGLVVSNWERKLHSICIILSFWKKLCYILLRNTFFCYLMGKGSCRKTWMFFSNSTSVFTRLFLLFVK